MMGRLADIVAVHHIYMGAVIYHILCSKVSQKHIIGMWHCGGAALFAFWALLTYF